jgi:hypothetical protein
MKMKRFLINRNNFYKEKMSSHIARIEIYPNYNKDGSMNLNLPFSYGCPELDLMGYNDIEELVSLIRDKLKPKEKWNKKVKCFICEKEFMCEEGSPSDKMEVCWWCLFTQGVSVIDDKGNVTPPKEISKEKQEELIRRITKFQKETHYLKEKK